MLGQNAGSPRLNPQLCKIKVVRSYHYKDSKKYTKYADKYSLNSYKRKNIYFCIAGDQIWSLVHDMQVLNH
jgi:hypothetical protein